MNQAWSSETLRVRCAADGEFRLAARFWTGGLRLEFGDHEVGFAVADGVPTTDEPVAEAPGVITLAGPEPVWAQLLAARPPRFCNDLFNLVPAQLSVRADRV